ncbi:MAG: ion transporter [Gemmatimonadetes bacterium]|nr:MAG: ion transporter [Gemmatimonadota bacterium]
MAKSTSHWKIQLHEIIFEADTPAGKTFDIVLIITILLSVLAVMLESIAEIRQSYGRPLRVMEWGFTLLFTVEYVLRLLCVGRPWKYAFSFYGIVDFLAVIPTYFSLIVPGTHYLLTIRILRILRVFRVLKLVSYLEEAHILTKALRSSRRKITVFIYTVLILVILVGSIMYVIEGEAHGFTSIPRSIYWAIVTVTTVGYGDISPQTSMGQMLAAVLMILGYGIIAVPTGIVTVELAHASGPPISTQACQQCNWDRHDADARFCKRCGTPLYDNEKNES